LGQLFGFKGEKIMADLTINKLFPAIQWVSLLGIATVLLRYVALLKSSRIEHLFYKTEKILFIQISRVLLITIPISLYVTEILLNLVPPYEAQMNGNQLEIYLAYFLVGYLITFFLALQIYMGFFSDYLGRFAYYIDHAEFGKLYILKTISKNEVLLYSQPRDYFIQGQNLSYIMKFDEVKQHQIYQELLDTGKFGKFLVEINKIITKPFNKKIDNDKEM
jgi:hypothetical protein